MACATTLCPPCQPLVGSYAPHDMPIKGYSVNILAAGRSGEASKSANTTPELATLLKVQRIEQENLVKERQIIEADSSSGRIFGTNGGESLISPYGSLPGMLTYSADPVAATSAYQGPIIADGQISPVLSTALIFIIGTISSAVFKSLTGLALVSGSSWLGYRKWRRIRRNAELRALGLKRIRVRKKHRKKSKSTRRAKVAVNSRS